MAEHKVILLEQDDLMHPNTGESNFNESAYYNFYDRGRKIGGFARLGNRPNEGYAEMTACLYLPDGTVGFMFRRPEIKDNHAHDAGGLKFEVIKPFEHHRVTYRGNTCILKDPLQMAEPRQAFKNNPHVAIRLELDYYATAPGWGGEIREKTAAGWESITHGGDSSTEFARGHLEQLGHAVGKLVIGEQEFKIDGLGLRDHSWGPRYWQAPKYYRWLTMNFDETLGAMATITVQRDGSERPGGFIARKGRPPCNIRKVEIETEFVGEQQLHDRIKVTCETEGAAIADRNHGQGAVDDSAAQPARRDGDAHRRGDDRMAMGQQGRLWAFRIPGSPRRIVTRITHPWRRLNSVAVVLAREAFDERRIGDPALGNDRGHQFGGRDVEGGIESATPLGAIRRPVNSVSSFSERCSIGIRAPLGQSISIDDSGAAT